MAAPAQQAKSAIDQADTTETQRRVQAVAEGRGVDPTEWALLFRGLTLQLAAVNHRDVIVQRATGTGNIANTFSIADAPFTLVFVRCHFSGSAGVASMVISSDSVAGSAYDTELFTILTAGVKAGTIVRDVNMRLTADEIASSAWSFQSGDAVKIAWTNPDSGNMTWSLEVGLARQ